MVQGVGAESQGGYASDDRASACESGDARALADRIMNNVYARIQSGYGLPGGSAALPGVAPGATRVRVRRHAAQIVIDVDSLSPIERIIDGALGR